MLMMPQEKNILEAIFDAIDEINEQREKDARVKKTEGTALLGAEGVLDSLGFVSLIVAVEQRIAERFGVTLTLADEKAMSRRNSPFRTVGTFADYIAILLTERISKRR